MPGFSSGRSRKRDNSLVRVWLLGWDGQIYGLQRLSKIAKRDRISYYHPSHYNYMMPRHFETLFNEVGFKVLPLGWYPPVPWVSGLLGRAMVREIKSSVRWMQNVLGLPYARHVYFVEK